MIDLTEMGEAVNVALAEDTPCLIATASKDGVPDIGFKGSTMVFDKEHLAFWERSHGEHIGNLRENPHIAVIYRSKQRGSHWRFYGVAELHTDGELREQVKKRVVAEELSKDPEDKGIAVVIRVDRVLQNRVPLQARE
jgi:predicted pyridoxine 5'-phosphate oxidase superfamily flavin-nucleotide-binding protein